MTPTTVQEDVGSRAINPSSQRFWLMPRATGNVGISTSQDNAASWQSSFKIRSKLQLGARSQVFPKLRESTCVVIIGIKI